jgi:hypothetical protein
MWRYCTRAIQDAHPYQAYSCEYIAIILEQRQRKLPEPGALRLTRAADLLELELPEPDLSVYDPKPNAPSDPPERLWILTKPFASPNNGPGCTCPFSRKTTGAWPIKAARFPLLKTLDQFDWNWSKKINRPQVQHLFSLGYLPIDKTGADLLFQIISGRYENGSTIITTNQIYKHWSRIFNNDSTITSAVLDRLLHHNGTVIIEGKSYRMKDQIDPP